MDVIYPYLGAPDDFELRYSLRSLANLRHDRVIVAGDQPGIISDRVWHVPVRRMVDRYRSSTTNILAAIEYARVDGDFIMMHDDMFLLDQWDFRHEHRGPVSEYLASGGATGTYRQVLRSTYDILRLAGISEPLFFGLHTPAVYNARKLVDLANQFQGRRYLTRTLYFNLHSQPSIRREDVKVKRWGGDQPVGGVLSISDEVSRNPRFRSWIENRFPVPSIYERGLPE